MSREGERLLSEKEEKSLPQSIPIPKLEPEQKKQLEKELETQSRPIFFENRVKKAQRLWRRKTSSGALVEIKPSPYHTRDYTKFVNGQKVKKIRDSQKKQVLRDALAQGQWDAKIFEDKDIEYLTVSLFEAGEITAQQNKTILERNQVIKEKENIEIYPILDKNLQFTQEAEQILLPGISRRFPEKLTPQQKEEIRKKILELPLSERFFYLSDGSMYEKNETNREYKRTSVLGNGMVQLNVIPLIQTSSTKIIHSSAGFREAYGDIVFGRRNHVKNVAVIGKKTLSDIETGVRDHERYSEINCQENNTENKIHQFTEVPPSVATDHDFYHSIVMSLLGEEIRQGFLNLVDAIREAVGEDLKNKKTGEIWSKEIWDLIDAEYLYIFHFFKEIYSSNWVNNNCSAEKITALFIYTLMHKGVKNYILPKKDNSQETKETLTDTNRNITPIGVILLLNFLDSPEKWQKIKIDFDLLPMDNPMRSFYREIKHYYPLIKDYPKKIQIVSMMLLQYFKNTNNQHMNFSHILNFITDNSDIFLSKIKFNKLTNPEDINKNNTIFLSYDNIPFDMNSENNGVIFDKMVADSILKSNQDNPFINGFNMDFKGLKYIIENYPDKEKALNLVNSFYETYSSKLRNEENYEKNRELYLLLNNRFNFKKEVINFNQLQDDSKKSPDDSSLSTKIISSAQTLQVSYTAMGFFKTPTVTTNKKTISELKEKYSEIVKSGETKKVGTKTIATKTGDTHRLEAITADHWINLVSVTLIQFKRNLKKNCYFSSLFNRYEKVIQLFIKELDKIAHRGSLAVLIEINRFLESKTTDTIFKEDLLKNINLLVCSQMRHPPEISKDIGLNDLIDLLETNNSPQLPTSPSLLSS